MKKIFKKIVYCILIFNFEASNATNRSCDSSPSKKPKLSIQNKVISLGSSADKLYLIVNNKVHIDPIEFGKIQKIYEVKLELNNYLTNQSDTYMHFFSDEISRINSEINHNYENNYYLKSDGLGSFRVASGTLKPSDVISIPVSEALKQINARKTILINHNSSDNQTSVKYLLNFKKLYAEIKLNTENESENNLPKVNEEIVNTKTLDGQNKFEKFKNALFTLRQTVQDPSKTIMVIKNIEQSDSIESSDELTIKKLVEAREKILQGLDESQVDSKQNTRSHNAKKTISYAEFQLISENENYPEQLYYSISGENFKFVTPQNSNKIFVNLKKNNFNFPYTTPAENPLKNMQRILQATKAIRNGEFQNLSSTRYSDSEAKILEAIVDKTKDTGKSTQGTLKIYTSKPACISCRNVYNYFKELRPNINLKILTLSEVDSKNLYKISY
ncbi:deaminase domain-containing protein [Fluviispira multicolorata]|uniref:Uncharacterized protein n=1 Tax=Fluviispira multicolorata TaxID=2654512 RepID=A0A833JE85_9BACT|nr:deaminase domain-containing protein [Fluviispira multicolorata]KAB8029810.1 hypothetical protein GCL57_09735 [Fluviispira multicolorata]